MDTEQPPPATTTTITMTGVDSIAGGGVAAGEGGSNDDGGVISGENINTTGTNNGTHNDEIINKNGDNKTETTTTTSSTIDIDIFGGNNNDDSDGTISQIVGQLESSIELSLLMDEKNSLQPPSISSSSSSTIQPTTINQQQSSLSINSQDILPSMNNNNDDNNTNNSDKSEHLLNESQQQQQINTSSPPTTTTTTNGSLYNNDNHSLNFQSSSSSSSVDNIVAPPPPITTTATNVFDSSNNEQESNQNNNNNKNDDMLMNHVKNSNLLSSSSTAESQPEQQQQTFESSSSSTTTTMTGAGGKRILLSANSPQPVNSSISNMTQQTTLLKSNSNSLTNGTMTPPESPSLSLSNTSLSTNTTVASLSSSSSSSSSIQQQPIAIGQLNSNVVPQQQQSNVIPSTTITNNTTMPLITSSSSVSTSLPAMIRSTPISMITTQIQQTSAITTSTSCSPFVMTTNQINNNNNNNVTNKMPMAQKTAPILNLQQTNGGQQQMLIQTQPSTNQTIRTNHHQIQMPQVSLSNSIVLDPRAQQQAHLQQQLANVSAHNQSNLQFQIVNVNSPSRNTLQMPTAVSAPAGYAVSNIITGTSGTTIQSKTGTPMQPRLVQFQNSPVRLPNRATSFASPLTFPGLVRGQAIFVKTENGQMHMVNVSPQALAAASPQTVAGHQLSGLRLQLPTAAAQTGTANISTTGPTNVTIQPPTSSTIRTQLSGNQIVLPVSLAATAGGNTQVATIPANKVSQILPPSQMIAGNVSIPTPTMQTIVSTQSSPSNVTSNSVTTSASSGHQAPQLRVHTTATNSQVNSAAPSQMSPTTAKMKCKNFLSTLIRLASEQPESVATNVKSLIQGLIDDTIQPEDFTTQLQRELNSSEQPCLVPFLKKSLPFLRYSLMKEELKIEGVRPPPPSATMAYPSNHHPMAGAQNLSHIQNISPVPTISPQSRPSPLPPGVRLLGPNSNLMTTGNVPAGAQIITSLQPPHQQQLHQPPLGSSNHLHHHHHQQQQNSLGPIVLTSPNHHTHCPTITSHTGHQHPGLMSMSMSMSPNIQTTNTSLSHQRLPIHSNVQQQSSPLLSSPSSLASPSLQTPPPPAKSKKSSSKSKAKSEKAKKEKAAASVTSVASTTSSSTAPLGSTIVPGGERNATATASSSFREDDDINDVAAMGGVNLAEESQRILAGNAEIIGQQIRSCKDEPFLYTSPLQQKLNKIVKRYDLEDCSHDVVALVSHAAEERLKTLVEHLGAIAEHRQENLRTNHNYEIVQDVKAQAQFLQELDRIEKRRHEEQEREVLIKAAKSRSKVDDPDHIAIKARAKEMQRLEMEELRQREANKTALQAIGNPKKRLKTMNNNSTSSTSLLSGNDGDNSGGVGGGGSIFSSLNGNTNKTKNNNNSLNIGQSIFGSSFGSSRTTIKRYKRVTMKDVLFMMERDRTMVRSTTLFKAYSR